MTNPMFNPQPNYSGVTIQIANPAVNVGQYDGRTVPCVNSGCYNVNQCGIPNNQGNYINYPQVSCANGTNIPGIQNDVAQSKFPQQSGMTNPIQDTGYPNAYPAQYYMNNYNYGIPAANDGINNYSDNKKTTEDFQKGSVNTGDNQVTNEYSENNDNLNTSQKNLSEDSDSKNLQNGEGIVNSYKMYAKDTEQKENDMTKSQNIIGDLSEREAKIAEEKKNTKETKIVALTDEYIKSLENYLDNPNDEIRLMASKEILTRLDEDKDRYDDAALNALLNKMLQDPNKLVRIAALSAFASQLASGNDYTVTLLHNIQSNPNSDKEDVLQAADILLKMSAGVEVKNIPNPSVKEKQEQ